MNVCSPNTRNYCFDFIAVVAGSDRLVDDRCVVQRDGSDLSNPPKKFRGAAVFFMFASVCIFAHIVLMDKHKH